MRRRRKLLAIGAGALVLPAAALAAFVIYTGVNGSGQGTFETGTTTAAFTVTGTSQPVLTPGVGTPMNVSITNNDPASHVLNSIGGTFSSSPGECASHLSVSNPSSGLIDTYTGAQTKTGTVQIDAAASLPTSCSAGSWSVAFTGTTTP